MTIYLYNSVNGSEPLGADLKDYAGIYLQANDSAQFATLRNKYFGLGIYWGAWFNWKEDSTLQDADGFAGILGGNYGSKPGNSGDLPPVIRLWFDPANKTVSNEHLGDFVTEFKRVFGRIPVLEISNSIWNSIHKFQVPSIIEQCPLLTGATSPKPHALTYMDDTTISFEGTKTDLIKWSQTYEIPTNPVPVPTSGIVTDAEIVQTLEIFKRWWKQ